MQTMILIGSARPGAYIRATASALTATLEARGDEAIVWDPREWRLTLADPDWADGFTLISPVYHNSYSALLKNCLDPHDDRPVLTQTVALVARGPNRCGVQVCDHLRVVRGLWGWRCHRSS